MSSDETVVGTFIQEPDGDELGEVSKAVKHADGRKYYRPATWDEIRKIEREMPGRKGRLKPSDGPICEVPFFDSRELDEPGG